MTQEPIEFNKKGTILLILLNLFMIYKYSILVFLIHIYEKSQHIHMVDLLYFVFIIIISYKIKVNERLINIWWRLYFISIIIIPFSEINFFPVYLRCTFIIFGYLINIAALMTLLIYSF